MADNLLRFHRGFFPVYMIVVNAATIVAALYRRMWTSGSGRVILFSCGLTIFIFAFELITGARRRRLHAMLNDLIGPYFLEHPGKSPATTTVQEFAQWWNERTRFP